jgi:hypothetical protein
MFLLEPQPPAAVNTYDSQASHAEPSKGISTWHRVCKTTFAAAASRDSRTRIALHHPHDPRHDHSGRVVRQPAVYPS